MALNGMVNADQAQIDVCELKLNLRSVVLDSVNNCALVVDDNLNTVTTVGLASGVHTIISDRTRNMRTMPRYGLKALYVFFHLKLGGTFLGMS